MSDLIKILSGVASAKLNLLETLKFADNVELTVHFHLGNELYPSTIVQVTDPNSINKKAPATFVLDESNDLEKEALDPPKKELPFNIGSHIVLDEKFFSKSMASIFQHSKDVQFVPADGDKAVGAFMDGSNRTFIMKKASNISFSLDITTFGGRMERHLIEDCEVTITEDEAHSWKISKIKAGEYIKIPDDSLAIVSFDEADIACVFLISRKHDEHQRQHWVVVFPI